MRTPWPEPYYGEKPPAPPDASDMPVGEREAELLAGLAHREYELRVERLRDPDLADDRMTRDELYAMFRQLQAVSAKRATEWADEIVRRGVKR